MEKIVVTDSMSQVAGKVNDGFAAITDGYDDIVEGDSMSQVSGKAHDNFDMVGSDADTITAVDYMGQIADKLEDGFDGVNTDSHNTFRFLHISDPHGKINAMKKCNEMMGNESDIQFTFITGDITEYGYINGVKEEFGESLDEMSGKLLLLTGNHDTYDNKWTGGAPNQKKTTAFIKSKLGNNVEWGDETGVASYWHKDFQISESSKLRVIAIDQYEIDRVRHPGEYTYYTEYSQGQIDWLISLLTELNDGDYFIIALHQPPLWSSISEDPYAIAKRSSNLFVSELFTNYGNQFDGTTGEAVEPKGNLLPEIVKAFNNKEHLVMDYNNWGGSESDPDIELDVDFADAPNATFLFYLCGHNHCDIADYLPDESSTNDGDWSDQLMLCVTAADQFVNWSAQDDLGGMVGGSVPNTPFNAQLYRINEVVLDFDNKTIIVNRIGAKNTAGGRYRDYIVFNIEGDES